MFSELPIATASGSKTHTMVATFFLAGLLDAFFLMVDDALLSDALASSSDSERSSSLPAFRLGAISRRSC